MKIGYARVSTTEQNLDIQKQTLEEAGCERIFEEKYREPGKIALSWINYYLNCVKRYSGCL